MKKIVFAVYSTICFINTLSSQVISDSRGKDVFAIYSAKNLSLPISATSFGLNFNHHTNPPTTYHLVSNPASTTVTDAGGWAANISLKNINPTYSKFITPANQPTLELKAGWILNNVEKFNNWSNLQQYNGFLGVREFNSYVGIYANESFSNYYDTVSKQITPLGLSSANKFLNYGIETNNSLYFRRSFAVSITGNFGYGLTMDNLKSYQTSASQQINTLPPIYIGGNSAGKIGGDINNKTINARFCISTPLFLSALFTSVNNIGVNNGNFWSQVFILPLFASYGSSNYKWTQQMGFSFNFLKQGYGGLNSVIIPAGGFGIDWQTDGKAKTKWGTGQFYISASIDLGGLAAPPNGTLTSHRH